MKKKKADHKEENFVITDGSSERDVKNYDAEDYLFFSSNANTNNEKIDSFNDYIAPKNCE